MLLMNLESTGRRLLLTEYTPCSTWQAVYSRPQGISIRKSYTEKAYIFKTFPAARAFSLGNDESYTEKAYIFKTFSAARALGKKSYTENAYIFKTFPAARAFSVGNPIRKRHTSPIFSRWAGL